jgi:hypothetical protein
MSERHGLILREANESRPVDGGGMSERHGLILREANEADPSMEAE